MSNDSRSFSKEVMDMPPDIPARSSAEDILALKQEISQMKILVNEYHIQLGKKEQKVKMYESAFNFLHSIINK